MWHNSKIISGQGRGAKMGFPTLNLEIPQFLSVPHGIYAGWVETSGNKYKGAFHFGPIPTFHQQQPVLEVFVIDKHFQPIPKAISFKLSKKLRNIINFKDQKSLIDQIQKDVEATKSLIV